MADLLAKRFNNAEITRMANFLAENSYDKKIADLNLELRNLGDELYNLQFAEYLEQIKSIPQGWLETRSALSVSFINGENGHCSVIIPNFKENDWKDREVGRIENHSRDSANLTLNAAKPFPYSMRFLSYGLDIKSETYKKFIHLKTNIADTQKAKFDFKNEMIALLKNLGSFKKLYDFWPEVRELVSEFEPKASLAPMLPSAPLNEYNKLLGIPTEKKITATV